MDLNTFFLANHSEQFVESRRESMREFRYGNGSLVPAMIAALAAGTRRAAARIEGWARGSSGDVTELRLPRMNSAR